jgi:hypothetical protein
VKENTVKKWLVILMLAALSGCSYITAKDAVVIDTTAANAIAINAKVQQDANLPPYVRQWWAEDANQWLYMSDWAHGRRATAK